MLIRTLFVQVTTFIYFDFKRVARTDLGILIETASRNVKISLMGNLWGQLVYKYLTKTIDFLGVSPYEVGFSVKF